MPNLDSYRTILAGSVVFKGLTAPDLDAVLSAAELLPRKPKDLILSEGSPTDGLYVVLEGEVEGLPAGASGQRRPSAQSHPPQPPGPGTLSRRVRRDRRSTELGVGGRSDAREALLPVQGGVPPARRAARSPRPDRLRQPAPLSRQPAARQGQGARHPLARREVTAPRRRDPMKMINVLVTSCLIGVVAGCA